MANLQVLLKFFYLFIVLQVSSSLYYTKTDSNKNEFPRIGKRVRPVQNTLVIRDLLLQLEPYLDPTDMKEWDDFRNTEENLVGRDESELPAYRDRQKLNSRDLRDYSGNTS